jgi:hypothetical protein
MQRLGQAINTSGGTLSNGLVMMFKFGGWMHGHWKALALISIVAATSFVAAAYAIQLFRMPATAGARVTVTSPPLEFSMELDKTEFQQGENVQIRLSLKNIGDETIKLTWFSYYLYDDAVMYFDFYIKDADGTIVYQYTKLHGALGMLLDETLTLNEQLISVYVWFQKTDYPEAQVPAGVYTVRALTRRIALNLDDPSNADLDSAITLETPAMTFTIE